MRTMLYFGSFNPPHNGHVAIVRYVLGEGLCDRLWFVVSPRNPLKDAAELAPAADRLAMTRLAARQADPEGRAEACGIEFDLPLPSYTVRTLDELKARCPGEEFSILMGADAAAAFGRWKDWRRIAADYNIYVYPRGDARSAAEPGMRFALLDGAPEFTVSSTAVRHALESGADIAPMVPADVARYIYEHGLWTCTNVSTTK